jgi:hypothetical protein
MVAEKSSLCAVSANTYYTPAIQQNVRLTSESGLPKEAPQRYLQNCWLWCKPYWTKNACPEFVCVLSANRRFFEWRDPDSNRGHHDFQSCALPTELSRRRIDRERFYGTR